MFIRLLFTEPWMRELYADWEEVTRLAIAQLRMESARYPGDQRLADLVEELSARDAQFRQWWTAHDVAARGKGTKKLRHPVVGELTLDWDTLTCGHGPRAAHHRVDRRTRFPFLRRTAPAGLLGRGPEPDGVRHRRVNLPGITAVRNQVLARPLRGRPWTRAA